MIMAVLLVLFFDFKSVGKSYDRLTVRIQQRSHTTRFPVHPDFCYLRNTLLIDSFKTFFFAMVGSPRILHIPRKIHQNCGYCYGAGFTAEYTLSEPDLRRSCLHCFFGFVAFKAAL